MKRYFQRLFHRFIGLKPVYQLLWKVPYPKARIKTFVKELFVIVAKDRIRRGLGLSYRESMDGFQGMLFPFEGESIRPFHMRAMKFPLDLVWLNHDKKVIYISYNVLPERDSFSAPLPSQYILEIPAMKASEWGFKLGGKVEISFQ